MLSQLLLFTFIASADPLSMECQSKVKLEAVKNQPGTSLRKLNTEIAIRPDVRYKHEENTRVCVATQIRSVLVSDSPTSKICPNARTGYKLECFREWVANQSIGFAGQVMQLSTTAGEIARLDREDPEIKKKEIILPLLVESILIPLEKMSVTQNQSGEYIQLREQERKAFSQVKLDLIPLVESQLKKLTDSVAAGNGDAQTQIWLMRSAESLKARIEKIKLKQI